MKDLRIRKPLALYLLALGFLFPLASHAQQAMPAKAKAGGKAATEKLPQQEKSPAKTTPAPQAAQTVQAGQAFEPAINHEYESQIPFLFLISAFDSEAKKLNKPEEAERLFRNTQKGVLDSQDEAASLTSSSNLAKDSALLVGFYLANQHIPENKEKLKTAAQWLQKFAGSYGESSKKPGLKQRALYWVALSKFILSEGGDGISELIPLKEQLKGEPQLLANIDLLVGYSLAISPATSAQGFASFAEVIKDVSAFGRLGQRLTEAYVEYGLDAEGNPTGTVKPSAEAKIQQSIQIAKGMPLGVQHLVMNSAIYIWTRANPQAKIPPMLSDGFPGVIPVEALREIEALTALKAQNHRLASQLYRAIASSLGSSPVAAKLDARIWDIELLHFQKTGAIADLESSFVAFREKYKKVGKETQSIDTLKPDSLAEAYRGALDQLLNLALTPSSQIGLKQSAIDATMRYTKGESERQLSYPLKAKVAQLYRSLERYREAVDLYLDIAKDIPLKNYLLAIEAQSKLALWSTQPNFERAAPGDAAERSKLLGIYESVSQLKNGEDWFMLTHIGLLNRALNQPKKAEDLWLKSLKVNTNSKLAMESAGVLLGEFYQTKRWEDVIDLAHLLQQKKATPTSKGKTLPFVPWLGDALYNGGLADLQAQNFTRSVAHLEEFVQSFAADPRVPAATYSLAFGYKGQGKLVAALNACKIVIEKFPAYPLRSKVLLQAAEWGSSDKNTWEYAFFFYGKYLSDFKNEKNIPEIRVTLAELYLKRKLYGWAARLYREQSLAPNVKVQDQLTAAVKYMDIEEQYGEPKDAFAGAQRVTQLAGPKDPAHLHALAFMGRYVSQSKDLKGMADIEPKLIANSKLSKEVLESLGFVRFRRAEMLTKPIVYTENNLLIKDPEAVVKKYFDAFENEKQHYVRVCQVGLTSYCAPSLLRLTTVAKQGMEAVDKVTIAETLGPNRVNSFKVFKQLHLSKITQARKDFAEQALKLAKGNTTTASWREEIIKVLEYEDTTAVAH